MKLTESSVAVFLMAAMLIQVFVGLTKFANGDEGIYISGAYQYANGFIPHVNFWWPQGIGYPQLMGFIGKHTSFNLFPMRLVSLGFLILMIISAYSMAVLEFNTSSKKLLLISIMSVMTFQYYIFYNGLSVGTKEDYVIFLLIANIYLFYKCHSSCNLSYSISAGFFSAILLSAKPTHIFLVFTLFALLSIKKTAPVKFIAILGTAFAVLIVFHNQIILDPNGIANMANDLLYVANENKLRNLTVIDAFQFIKESALNTLLSLSFLIFIALKHKPRLNPLAEFFLWGWLGNYFGLIVIFYPGIFPVYLNQLDLLLALGIFFLFANESEQAKPFSTRDYIVLIIVVISYFSIKYASILKEIDIPLQFKYIYHSEDEAMVKQLDQLNKTGRSYLYIGRYQQTVIDTQMHQSLYSVGGTVNIDLSLPERNLANKMKVISNTNYGDLFQIHEVIVIDSYIFSHPNLNPSILNDALEKFKFRKIYCTNRNCLYKRQDASPSNLT